MTQLMRDWELVIVGVGSCGYGMGLLGPFEQSLSVANHVIHPFRLAQLQRHITSLLARTLNTSYISFYFNFTLIFEIYIY
jgi:hypothetical protein